MVDKSFFDGPIPQEPMPGTILDSKPEEYEATTEDWLHDIYEILEAFEPILERIASALEKMGENK